MLYKHTLRDPHPCPSPKRRGELWSCSFWPPPRSPPSRRPHQNNSLYVTEQRLPPAPNNSLAGPRQQPPQRTGMSLADSSWIYQSLVDRKTYEVNDIVKVSVKITSQMTSTGTIDRKKTGYSDWKLTNWIKFYPGANLGENGGVSGQPNMERPKSAATWTASSMRKATCKRKTRWPSPSVATSSTSGPTETWCLEGTWSINDNEEKWEYSLAGDVARKTSSRTIRLSATQLPT